MPESRPVVVSTTERGLEVHVHGIPGWEGFDQLTRYLVLHFAATITSSIDGPDARVRQLLIDETTLTLDYEDPYESTIVAADRESGILLRIAEDLTHRLT